MNRNELCYPSLGTKDLVFETTDGVLHEGCYDFVNSVIKGHKMGATRRWIDTNNNIYDSSQVTNWWISVTDIAKCKDCDNFYKYVIDKYVNKGETKSMDMPEFDFDKQIDKEYVPEIGDVVKYRGLFTYVVIDIDRSKEGMDSCCYDRTYTLCKEEYLSAYHDATLYEYDNIKTHGIDVRISPLAEDMTVFTKVEDIAPYEIIPTKCFKIRQKVAKTITIYE